MGLTPSEIESYRRDGLVVPGYRLAVSRLDALRAAVDSVLETNPGVRGERLINPHLDRGGRDGIRGAPAFLDLARDAEILDLVEGAIGPDIILWSSHLFCKPAGAGREVPWHQDGHYWPIRPLATCSVWVALDDVTLENGAMGWVPGSHASQQLYTHHSDSRDELALNQVLDPGQVDLERARYNVLEAGQLSLHDVYLTHGSEPNRSARRRAGFVCRYMPTTSVFDRALGAELQKRSSRVDFANRELVMMRGVDRSGGNIDVAGVKLVNASLTPSAYTRA